MDKSKYHLYGSEAGLDILKERLVNLDSKIVDMKREFADAIKRTEERYEMHKREFKHRFKHLAREENEGEVEISRSWEMKTENPSAAKDEALQQLNPDGRYSHHRSQSDTNTGDNQAEGEEAEDSKEKRYHWGGPAPPKRPTYDGKNEWRPYYIQFSIISDRYAWSEDQKLNNLVECLRDKALSFFSTQSKAVQQSYQKLCEKMEERFGRRDMPIIIRRQLQNLKQHVDEPIEEYAERVQELAEEGFPSAPDNFIVIVAVDAFLKGCHDKCAALTAINKDPMSLDEALNLVRGSMANHKVIYGSRGPAIKMVSIKEGEEFESSTKENELTGYRRLKERWNAKGRDVDAIKSKLESYGLSDSSTYKEQKIYWSLSPGDTDGGRQTDNSGYQSKHELNGQ